MPVSGQVKVDDKVWRELLKKLGPAKHARVKVGVLSSAGGSAAHAGSDLTLVELMAIHEYGSPAAGIPARAPIRRTFEENRDALEKFLARIGRQVINDKLSVEDALKQLGIWAEAQIKNRIRAHLSPPLAPSTLKFKLSPKGAGGSTPLVATGQLINSITSEVVK